MESLGAERKEITEVIGPCISQTADEVGMEFIEKMISENKNNRNIFRFNAETKQYHFD